MSGIKRKRASLGVTALAVLASALAFVLALGPLGQGEAAASAGPPSGYRLIENGDHASLWVAQPEAVPGDPKTACQVYVYVSRSGPGQARQTHLYYDVSTWDPTYDRGWGDKPGGCVSESGNGRIPNSAYRVRGTTHTLSVDTSALPGFERREGSGGAISLVWQRIRASEHRTSGSERSRTPGLTWHRSGTSSEWSATAIGRAIGVSVDVHGGETGVASVGSSNGACLSYDPNACPEK